MTAIPPADPPSGDAALTTGPWGDRSGEPSGPPAEPAARTGLSARDLGWALLSSGLLFAWIWWQMGWVWALAGVFGVLIHETGHVLAINALGCGPGRLTFVPFVGGAAYPKRPPDTEFKGVLIALAGPVFGLLAMAPFFVAYAVSGDEKWIEGAFFIAAINLINLLPAPPLDGSKAFGPALARIHPWLERGALLGIGGLVLIWAFSRGSLIFGLFVGLGVLGALRRGRLRPWAFPLRWSQWALTLALYAAAVALCGAAIWLTLDPIITGSVRRLVGA